MSQPGPTPTSIVPPNATGPAPSWFATIPDAEIIGHIQTKGWDKLEPAAAAHEAIKAHREAEKRLGIPSDQVARIPKDLSDEAGWKTLYERLGKPADPKEYGVDALDFDDEGMTARGRDHFRDSFAKANLTKDQAAAVAKSVQDFIAKEGASSESTASANLAAQKAELEKSWGPNFPANEFVAKQSAAELAKSNPKLAEAITALEGQMGYGPVMELFRQLGVRMGEDKFVSSPGGGNTGVMTREQATARRAELMADSGFRDRWSKGDAAAKRELDGLVRVIAG